MAYYNKIEKEKKDFNETIEFYSRYALKKETLGAKNNRIKKLEAVPYKWFEYYFSNYVTHKFSKNHIDVINDVINNKKYYCCLRAFRSFGKSVLTTIFIPAYLCLVKKELHFGLIVGNNDKKAKQLLKALQDEFKYNKLLQNDYPECEVTQGDGAKGDFSIKNGARFMALSIGISVRGLREGSKRVDYICCDDVDTSSKNITEVNLNNKLMFITDELMNTFNISGKYKRFILSNNLFSRKSITYEIGLLFIDKKSKIYKVYDINVLDSNGNSNWKSAISNSKIRDLEKDLGYSTFYREYMNTPIERDSIFTPNLINYVEINNDLSCYQKIVTYIDPSYTDDGDFKAMVTCALDGDSFIVLDIFLKRCALTTLASNLYNLYNILKLYNHINYNCYFEGMANQSILKNAFDSKQLDTTGNLIPVKVDKRKKPNKQIRIETLLPYFESKKVHFNISLKSKSKEAILQLLHFPTGSDDFPDALEGAIYKLKDRFFKPLFF